MLNSPQNHQAAAMGQSRSQRDCPGTLWVLLGSLLTAALLGNAFLARWPGASPAVAASAGTPTARAEPGSVASRFPRRNIEDIRVGERVLAHDPNANGSFDGVPTAVNPVTWKRLRLFAESRLLDGSPDDVHVETLQPPEWLRENHVAVGAQVPLPLDLVEMGLPPDLRARVVSIEPCPEIARGNGAVVLTTVNHLNGSVLDIDLLGPDGRFEALGVTATHRVWSATRRAWIPAASLQEGESLLGVDCPVVVDCVTRRSSTHRVYNLTVETRHVYNVNASGLLVHNSCGERFADAHDDLAAELADQFPHNTFDMNTRAGQNGPDAIYKTGPDPGFQALELKPDTEEANRFIRQRDLGEKWPEIERVMLMVYDEGGNFVQRGIW